MGGLRNIFDDMLFKGSILAGISSVILYKRNVYPTVTGTLGWLSTTVGAATVLFHLMNKENEAEGSTSSEDSESDSSSSDSEESDSESEDDDSPGDGDGKSDGSSGVAESEARDDGSSGVAESEARDDGSSGVAESEARDDGSSKEDNRTSGAMAAIPSNVMHDEGKNIGSFEDDSNQSSPDFNRIGREERMAEFNRLKAKLIEGIEEQQRNMKEVLALRRRDLKEEFEKESKLLEVRMKKIAKQKRLQKPPQNRTPTQAEGASEAAAKFPVFNVDKSKRTGPSISNIHQSI